MKNFLRKLWPIRVWLGYGLPIKLSIVIVVRNFLQSSFKLKRRILPSLAKLIVISNQNFSCELNPREITHCKLSHICPFNFNERVFLKLL